MYPISRKEKEKKTLKCLTTQSFTPCGLPNKKPLFETTYHHEQLVGIIIHCSTNTCDAIQLT